MQLFLKYLHFGTTFLFERKKVCFYDKTFVLYFINFGGISAHKFTRPFTNMSDSFVIVPASFFKMPTQDMFLRVLMRGGFFCLVRVSGYLGNGSAFINYEVFDKETGETVSVYEKKAIAFHGLYKVSTDLSDL
jgi:hypothetical protein